MALVRPGRASVKRSAARPRSRSARSFGHCKGARVAGAAGDLGQRAAPGREDVNRGGRGRDLLRAQHLPDAHDAIPGKGRHGPAVSKHRLHDRTLASVGTTRTARIGTRRRIFVCFSGCGIGLARARIGQLCVSLWAGRRAGEAVEETRDVAAEQVGLLGGMGSGRRWAWVSTGRRCTGARPTRGEACRHRRTGGRRQRPRVGTVTASAGPSSAASHRLST